jgi:hypothetical protein
MWSYWIWLYKQPRDKKKQDGGDNGNNRLRGKYLVYISCNVERVQAWKKIWGMVYKEVIY